MVFWTYPSCSIVSSTFYLVISEICSSFPFMLFNTVSIVTSACFATFLIVTHCCFCILPPILLYLIAYLHFLRTFLLSSICLCSFLILFFVLCLHSPAHLCRSRPSILCTLFCGWPDYIFGIIRINPLPVSSF